MSAAVAQENTSFLRSDSARSEVGHALRHMSLADFIAFSSEAQDKHELVNGEVVCVGKASIEHNRINANLIQLLGVALDALGIDGEALASDQGVFIDDETIFLPDTVLILGEARIDGQDNLRNPFALFEILSASTAGFDQGKKFAAYQAIASLSHYLLISQYEVSVTHYAKSDGGQWAVVGQYTRLNDTIILTVGEDKIILRLSAVYRRVLDTKE